MKFEIPKIYPITDVPLSGLTHAEQAKRLIEGGSRIVQFREKYAAPRDWFDDLRNGVEICRQSGVTSIVNDRVDVALAAGADGVHLGQTDLPPDAARRVLGNEAIIGYSTHSIEQAIKALEYKIDYLAFGPVFPTMTKEYPDAVVGLDLLRVVHDLTGEMPLVAIGGIDLENAGSVFAAGADSAALISALIADGAAIAERTSEFVRRYA